MIKYIEDLLNKITCCENSKKNSRKVEKNTFVNKSSIIKKEIKIGGTHSGENLKIKDELENLMNFKKENKLTSRIII
tara:strand:+ start:383 stop:613 length:231 start_codon:yes stop_codon:yes gene_type:complete